MYLFPNITLYLSLIEEPTYASVSPPVHITADRTYTLQPSQADRSNMRYHRAYNPFTSGSEEDNTNHFHSGDEETGDQSEKGSMVNLISSAKEYNPFSSSGEEDHPQQIHNNIQGKPKKLRQKVRQENKTLRSKDLAKITIEYNPFSSSEEEEDQLLHSGCQTSSKSGKMRGKLVGLVIIILGMVLLMIVLTFVLTQNRQMFYKEMGNTSVTSDFSDTDLGEIHE